MTLEQHKGGCQCGAVKFTINTKEFKSYICHCLECQKQTASAFAISVPLNRSEISIDGELHDYRRRAASGATTECYFCPTCGTRIFHQSSNSKNKLTLKGGTLDNCDVLAPIAHLWVSRKQEWVILPDGIEVHLEQPNDLTAWRAELFS